MARIVERPKAHQDVEDMAVRIADRRPSSALRFLGAVEKAYTRLAEMPGVGSVWPAETQHFCELRYFPIPRYPNYVIFYRELDDGIEIVRVLHASRNLGTIVEGDNPSRC